MEEFKENKKEKDACSASLVLYTDESVEQEPIRAGQRSSLPPAPALVVLGSSPVRSSPTDCCASGSPSTGWRPRPVTTACCARTPSPIRAPRRPQRPSSPARGAARPSPIRRRGRPCTSGDEMFPSRTEVSRLRKGFIVVHKKTRFMIGGSVHRGRKAFTPGSQTSSRWPAGRERPLLGGRTRRRDQREIVCVGGTELLQP
jgi:hypothetical protein